MTANILNFPVQREPEVQVKFDQFHRARLIKEMGRLNKFIVHISGSVAKDMDAYCEESQYEGIDGLMYLFELEGFYIYRLEVLLEKLNDIGG